MKTRLLQKKANIFEFIIEFADFNSCRNKKQQSSSRFFPACH